MEELKNIEEVGLRIELEELFSYENSLQEKADVLQERLFSITSIGNLSSNKDVLSWMASVGITPQTFTAAGNASLNQQEIQSLIEKSEFPHNKVFTAIQKARKIASILKHVKQLKTQMVKEGDVWIVRPKFNLESTTGRFYCGISNLAKQVRTYLLPMNPEHRFMLADWSLHELRVIAADSGCVKLKQIMLEAEDPLQELSGMFIGGDLPTTRDFMKELIYGNVYGMNKFGLSKRLSVSEKTAHYLQCKFFSELHGLKQWADALVKLARAKRTVVIWGGRTIPITKNVDDAQFQRMAVNYRVQGSANFMLRMAIKEMLPKLSLEKMVMLSHDAILFSHRPDDEASLREIIKGSMDLTVKGVRFPVKITTGDNWAEAMG